jgi:N-acetylglucosamine-6-phosphate deacetylase
MTTTIRGRLVLDDRIVGGAIGVEDGRIATVEIDDAVDEGPLLAPGFVDVHVHGWGGHSAMGDAAALDGMSRALLAHGVTSFLPSAWSTPLPELLAFAERVRDWLPAAPGNGSQPLGFNLEGPFLSTAKKGAHDPRHLRVPADVPFSDLEPLIDGLRLITVARQHDDTPVQRDDRRRPPRAGPGCRGIGER